MPFHDSHQAAPPAVADAETAPLLEFGSAADQPDTTGSRTVPSAATVTDAPVPSLTDYDVILVNSSAGKDSQASLDVVVEQARAAGVLDRVVVVHADLWCAWRSAGSSPPRPSNQHRASGAPESSSGRAT